MKLPYILLILKAQNNTVLREAFREACGDKEQKKGKQRADGFLREMIKRLMAACFQIEGLCSRTQTSGQFTVDEKLVTFQQRQ